MSVNLNPWFFIALGVWIATSIARNVYEALKYKRTSRQTGDSALQERNQTRTSHGSPDKKAFRVMMAVMFLMWAAWGFMAFSDPVRFTSVGWLRWVGAGMFGLGAVGFVLSEVHRGKGEGFSTSGVYSVFRHPMYVSQALMAAGVALFGMGLVSVCLVAVWIIQMVSWAVAEERELLKWYPEYARYRKKTFI